MLRARRAHVQHTHRRTVERAEAPALSRNTPYAGMDLPGRVPATFLRGTATVLDGKLA